MANYAQAALVTNGLVARYDAANASSYSGSGTRLNNLQSVGHATLYNNPSYTGGSNPYLSFNGSNQYFITENLTNFFPGTYGSKSNAISVYLWVYPTDAGVLVAEQGQTSLDGVWYDAQIEITNVIGNSGTLRCGTWSGSVIQSVSTNITLNQWNFIGISHTGTSLKAYLNGVNFGTRNFARSSPFNNNANQYYTFGAGTATNMGDGSYTNARFGQMGVYNTALTDADMRQNYETIAGPSIASSLLNFSGVTQTSLTSNWTSGNGQGRLVVCRPSSASITIPTNATNYTSNSNYGSGSTIGNGFVVGSGNSSNLTISNLQANTNYCLDIFEYNGNVSSSNALFLTSSYLTGCTSTPAITPSVASSNFSTTGISNSTWAGSFTAGNGANRLVICRPSNAAQTAPTNFANYTANSTHGSGSSIGSGFVVGAGNISSISLSNLSSNTTYCMDIYEFNGSISSNTAVFGNTALSACNTTLFNTPSVASSNFSTTGISSSTWAGSFTAGNGANRLVICRPSNTAQTAPTNLSNYTANTVYGSGSSIGSGYVVGTGSINSIAISNLNANTIYCLDVFEFNGSNSSNTAVFKTTALTACNTTRFNAPTSSSSNLIINHITDSSLAGSFQSGAGSGRIIVCRQSQFAATSPQNFSVYSASSKFGQGSAIGNGFVVGFGSASNLTISGLVANSSYCIDIYEYNGSIAEESAVFNTNNVLSICQKTNMVYPFTGASNFTLTQNNPTSLSVSWTNGDGNGRIVLVSTNAAPNASPVDASNYNASNSFGSGSTIGNAYVAYNSNGNSFTLNNLEPNTQYYFSIIEHTINGEELAYASTLALVDSATTIPADTDNDGVVDVDDMYPNDQYRAYATSYPANGYGTLLFEDLWPAVGDYDFNDLVIDYRYTVIANADNNAVEATFKFVTRAIGGALHNGFAFQFNGLNPAKITSITGTKVNGITWTSINPNGTEVGNNTNANIPVIKDAYDLLPTTGGYWFVNVDPNAPDVGTDTTTVVLTFINNGTAPEAGTAAAALLSSVNFNPYIVVAQERGKEIHLANMPPSDLMNMGYFGTINDRSNPGANTFYKSEQGLPWALNVDQSIPYTIEKTDFVTAYPNFFNWATSGATQNTDWYLNNNGNRVNNKLINNQ